VVNRAGQQVAAEELIQFCRSRLAHYKCPKQIFALDELPHSATGKVLRRELRARFKRRDQTGT
jgi:fatty-acyl-CoA synthase